MRVVRSVVVDCHPDDVLAYLLREGGRFEGTREPQRVVAREGDLTVTYTLEPVWTSTRLTRAETVPDGPRGLRRLRAVRRGARAGRRLRAVRLALERGAPR